MKRRDLIRKLEELGCVLVRDGGSHDWYTNHSRCHVTMRFTRGSPSPSSGSSVRVNNR
ncbi:MAG: type II toxin-antitoxin system HicA family toxin [Terriglobia bacterium]